MVAVVAEQLDAEVPAGRHQPDVGREEEQVLHRHVPLVVAAGSSVVVREGKAAAMRSKNAAHRFTYLNCNAASSTSASRAFICSCTCGLIHGGWSPWAGKSPACRIK